MPLPLDLLIGAERAGAFIRDRVTALVDQDLIPEPTATRAVCEAVTHRTETLRYMDPNGDVLTVRAVPDASSYAGNIPVVELETTPHTINYDAEPTVLQLPLDDVDDVIAALCKARDEAARNAGFDVIAQP